MPPVTIDGTNGITTPMYSGAISANAVTPVNSFKNRIINGNMSVDQRNAGASVSVTNGTITYGADRFLVFENTSASSCTVQQVTDAPTGFNNSLKFTVGTGSSATASQLAVLESRIEGYNFADLGFGTASAKTFTLSFQVKSTATGTYCVAFRNASDNRSYVSTYTISSANTWEQKTVTVVGDTTGTWGTTNGIGISVRFDMGSGSDYQTSTLNAWQAGLFFSNSSQVNIIGTNSASLQITGVQLEVGSTATSFDYRPYGTELALCQRYFEKSYNQDVAVGTVTTSGAWIFQTTNLTSGAATLANTMPFAVVKRAAVTPTFYSPSTGASGKARDFATAADVNANANTTGTQSFSWFATMGATQTQINFGVHWTISAEL